MAPCADVREAQTGPFVVVALQATSPIREAADISGAIAQYAKGKFDTIFSASEGVLRLLITIGAIAAAVRDREAISCKWLLLCSPSPPSILRETDNRMGGRIGFYLMERHKMFQIDRPEDFQLCAAIMKGYGYA